MKPDTLTYDQAAEELRLILERMQQPETGLEELGTLTQRAQELLRVCRTRLRQLDGELHQLLAEDPEPLDDM